ncbi:hypothetical protein M408DRAFT_333156 [Serendipita vermifera MAFF 305830]|uniref:1-acyl-sn-glycerol-3-phosphate acyltransferase n=1 Tax=Serendipita vermifera MAFF 305830 TaxID=933852 RepID=A0A0C3ABA6_SERVB|nr:hypothetical protein M408DRAFT_333156 [Serendipita vermifera MAFF 305830]
MGSSLSILRPLAYISLPLLAIRFAASKSSIVRYYWRLGIYVTSIAVISVWGACLSVALFVIGKRFDVDFWIARSFYFVAGNLLGIKFEIEGEEYLATKPAVLLGNHQSMLDILYVGPIFPRATVMSAKKELRWVPFLGLFMIAGGTIFLDRRNPQVAIASLQAAGEHMKKRGLGLWMFPEGTRTLSEEPNLKPFKKGAFHLAVQSGLPIVPVVCENYWKIYRKGVFDGGVLKIKVLPPIQTTGLTTADVPELAKRTRDLMLQALQEISQPYTGPKSSAGKLRNDSTLMPPPPPPSDVKSIGITEIRPAGQETDNSRQRTPSLVRSTASSEGNGSQETEEEDGHVLVRKPAAA